MRERYFRGIAHPADHRFAEKRLAQSESVKAPDQTVAIPAFDRVRATLIVERGEHGFDRRIDPGIGAILRALCAKRDHLLERGVGGDAEAVRGDRLAQRLRQMKAVERQDGAFARLDPIDSGGIAGIGHRKDAYGISAEHEIGVEQFIGWLGQRLHFASRFSIVCQSAAKAWAAAERPANCPTGARRSPICSTTLAIGTTGQSACAATASP